MIRGLRLMALPSDRGILTMRTAGSNAIPATVTRLPPFPCATCRTVGNGFTFPQDMNTSALEIGLSLGSTETLIHGKLRPRPCCIGLVNIRHS